MTRVLSDHDSFKKDLYRVERRSHRASATAAADVPKTQVNRRWIHALPRDRGDDLTSPTIVQRMLGNDEPWEAVGTFHKKTLSLKEAAKRQRKVSSLLEIRRQRPVRRQNTYTLLQTSRHRLED
ncbi:hypothetical protein EVAR_13176_1 [Eumeta japonica]|uniref:Uncharacterized protein n=1 Tax=Eumeta variegata TaxID=151549 RepID=A0A4C1TS34_EUMVA|nr:hypothetical protein EVAR_13176_1 [Eumeta japonica]